jgi:hypothetical protein
MEETELFRELSELEQASLAGGQLSSNNCSLQFTNVQTTAMNTVNLGGGEVSTQVTTYRLSQITVVSPFSFPTYFLANLLGSLFS